ncbi:endonuclease/exonuclease/phosphatase family protein [Flavobacterium agricola]|uniref:endonuclease/exonuclease/phosphatase family protein n=1 Tax=Flavobacterium agricola TaxID=2870839 RepID=UPI0022226ACA|nr:endonuclease/exonuclease/phosphatase family protein [Flavobacterium agricola]
MFYKFGDLNELPEQSDISILSYNVHLFNKYDWMPDKEVSQAIKTFIQQVNPDVVCLQEFTSLKKDILPQYKYRHVVTKGKNIESGLAIFSKHPIVNKGNLDFKNTFNNTIYADIKVQDQVIRIYTMHLESLGIANDINEEVDKLDENKSKRIFKKVQTAFLEQQEQAENILNHRQNILHPVIITGDMNNSAFSYAYHTIRGDLNDAFVEAGKGFGKSYDFRLFPFRIDYILTDKNLQLKEFTTFNDFKKSDHYPVYARFKIKKEDQ